MNTRKVIANISLSLDGRTAGRNGEYDMGWIVPHAITDGARNHMIAVTSPATTALLGRKNYQGFQSYWPSVANDENADPRDRAFSRWLTTVEKFVFSSTLKGSAWENTSIVNTDPAMLVQDLRQREGGNIIVLSSSSIIKNLLQADVLDSLSVTLCPEIVGGGPRLLDDGFAPSSWVLRQSNPTESGALCVVYDRVR